MISFYRLARRYLDNSTPFMKGADGREMLDLGAFLVTLPWLVRVVANRFLLEGIISKCGGRRASLCSCSSVLSNCAIECSAAGERLERVYIFCNCCACFLSVVCWHLQIDVYHLPAGTIRRGWLSWTCWATC